MRSLFAPDSTAIVGSYDVARSPLHLYDLIVLGSMDLNSLSTPSLTLRAAMLSAIALAAAAADKPTNFVVLFMDDNGWGDSSVNMGADAVHETPNMQKMADEGITFSDFHSSYSVCTASRAALLTGRLAPRTGVANNFGPTSSFGMAPGELTIADVLGAHGYETHMIGKVNTNNS